MSNNENLEIIADQTKRDFMKKFGKYAASAPVAGFVLMSASSSQASVHSGIRSEKKEIKKSRKKKDFKARMQNTPYNSNISDNEDNEENGY